MLEAKLLSLRVGGALENFLDCAGAHNILKRKSLPRYTTLMPPAPSTASTAYRFCSTVPTGKTSDGAVEPRAATEPKRAAPLCGVLVPDAAFPRDALSRSTLPPLVPPFLISPIPYVVNRSFLPA